MRHPTPKRRTGSLILAAAVAAGCVLPAAAVSPIGDGVRPTFDEAYYATLDYYGNLLEGSVVKSYALNGFDEFTDYGSYDEVINLTDNTLPAAGNGVTSFRFDGSAPDHFYFEGKTARPFEALPWTVTLHYALNGVPTRAEDLPGQRGVVEIFLDIVPNPSASAYARYNYTLEAAAMFNQDDILSLEAPGAQVQLVGNLRTVLFLALPGEEQHFTIRVGSDDFSFGGMTVLMVPATLAQLEEISKLSQRKDDLEEDYKALSGSLDRLLDALSDMQGGLAASASGLDQLDLARQTISDGKGALYGGTDALRGDLGTLADLLEPVEQQVQTLSQTVTDSSAVLNSLTDAAVSLGGQLEDLEDALENLEDGTGDLRSVLACAGDLRSSLRRLQSALGGTPSVDPPGGNVSASGIVQQVKDLHGIYDTKDQMSFFAKMMKLSNPGLSDEAIAESLKSVPGLLQIDKSTAEQMGVLDQWELTQGMNQLHTGISMGLGFQAFCGSLPGVSKTQAKQMNDLWIIYSSGSLNPSAPAPGTPPVVPPGETSSAAPSESLQPPAVPEELSGLPGDGEETALSASLLHNDPGGDSGSGGSTGGDSGSGGSTGGDSGSGDNTGGGSGSGGSAAGESGSGGSTGGDSGSGDNTGGDSGSGDNTGGDSGSGDNTGGDSTSGDNTGGDSGSGDNTGGGSDSGDNTGGDSGSGDNTGGDSGSGDNTGGDSGSGDNTGGDSGSGDNTGGEPGQPLPPSETVGGAVVDLITGGLDDASKELKRLEANLAAAMQGIAAPTAAVAGDLANLCGRIDNLTRLLDDAEDLTAALRRSSRDLQSILRSADDLRQVLNAYEPTLQETLRTVGSLSASAVATVRDAESLLGSAESLLKTSGVQLDAGTKQTLHGLADSLRQAARAMAATSDIRDAKHTVTGIIEDTWNEYTGDINNLLLMDATASPVSLTDERNPAPASIQILIRTQEIKMEEPKTAEEEEASGASSTFWGRIAQMFRDFWSAVTGVFH